MSVTEIPANLLLQLVDPKVTGVEQQVFKDPGFGFDITGVEVPGGDTISYALLNGLKDGNPIVHHDHGGYSIVQPDGADIVVHPDDVELLQGLADAKMAEMAATIGNATAAVTGAVADVADVAQNTTTAITGVVSDVADTVTLNQDEPDVQPFVEPITAADVLPTQISVAAPPLGEAGDFIREPREQIIELQQELVRAGIDIGEWGQNGDGVDGVIGNDSRAGLIEAGMDPNATLEQAIEFAQALPDAGVTVDNNSILPSLDDIKTFLGNGDQLKSAAMNLGADVVADRIIPGSGGIIAGAIAIAKGIDNSPQQPEAPQVADIDINIGGPTIDI